MLGVSRLQQWKERITSRELAETIGMTESMAEILRRHRLRWLGHVARMEDSRMPKQLLFGELERPRPDMAPREDGGTWWWQMSKLLGSEWLGMEWHRTGKSGRRSADSAVPMTPTRM